MKQLKKLTRYQKQKLTKKGFDPDEYGLKHEDKESFTVAHREGKKKDLTFQK